MDSKANAISLDNFFDIKPANAWIDDAKEMPTPKQLFDYFWLERELAILFGDTGMGKSLLAVQIGESIARGEKIRRLRMTAERQPVVYLDFELSPKQFEMRYSGKAVGDDEGKLINHYQFSPDFQRIQLRPDVFRLSDTRPLESLLRELIEPLVESTGAKVLIIDNITYLRRRADSTYELAPLMKELRRLKEQYGLSILVIAHTSKKNANKPLDLNDMTGSKVLANFADSIFAIGKSRLVDLDNPYYVDRYVKHIKVRSSILLYDAEAVPSFQIKRLGGNFLGFDLMGFTPESIMLEDPRALPEWEEIDEIKKLSNEKKTIREISESMQIPKSTVHRYLKMWKPRSKRNA